MLTVKEAVAAASQALRDLFEVPEVRLEEIERTKGDKRWLITLSFVTSDPVDSSFPIAVLAPALRKLHREYKRVEVDPSTGEVKAITIRQP